MSRLSLRLRLTVAFAVAMALVLATVGIFLHVRVGRSLERQLDKSLRVRADALAGLVQTRGSEIEDAELGSANDDGFAQVLALDGSVAASSAAFPGGPVVTGSELARGTRESYFLRRDAAGLDDDPEPARLLVTPVRRGGRTLVLVVVASAEDLEKALERLRAQLFTVGPLALLLSSLAGYLLAAAALRPVEAMRRQATRISSERPGQRLPLPKARDEVRRLGETLNAMLDRLEAAIARERRFIADASHELRTPLALLRTELELALRRRRSREELELALRSAVEEVERLTRLAEDLLVLAQMDDGVLPLRRSEIVAGELLEAVARRFAARALDEGRELEVVAEPDAAFDGDRVRLEQALANLVDNALRHGGGTVRLEAHRRDGRMHLCVSDQGAGFPPGFLSQAFGRFTRADAARGRGGAGLGLAIVDAVARAHGGRVEAANDDGRGAVLTLVLPQAPPL